MLADNECNRKGKMWRGCKFEARYDVYEPSNALQIQLGKYWALSETDKAMLTQRSVYVQDVCIRCGKVAARCQSNPE